VDELRRGLEVVGPHRAGLPQRSPEPLGGLLGHGDAGPEHRDGGPGVGTAPFMGEPFDLGPLHGELE